MSDDLRNRVALAVEGMDTSTAEGAWAVVDAALAEMGGVREEYCVKCGAPRSNHPYRHPFEARKSVQDFFLTEERKNDE